MLLLILISMLSTCTAENITEITGGYVQLDARMVDLTRFEGEIVKIKCEISGYPLPTYLWTKDGVPLNGPEASPAFHEHFSIKTTVWGSRLRISLTSVDDSGVYECTGYNLYGRSKANATLKILPELNPNPDRYVEEEGQREDGGNLDIESDLEEQFMLYKDRISGAGRRGGGRSHGPSVKDQQDLGFSLDDVEEEGGRGFCEPYRGVACSQALKNQPIFAYGSLQQAILEDQITAILTSIASLSGMSGECQKFAMPALCHYMFPVCGEGMSARGDPGQDRGDRDQTRGDRGQARGERGQAWFHENTRRLCRSDCALLHTDVCRKEYEELLRFSDSRLLAPNCSQLIDDSARCVHLGVTSSEGKHQSNEISSSNDQSPPSPPMLWIIIPSVTIPLVLILIILLICVCKRYHHSSENDSKFQTTTTSDELSSILVHPTSKLLEVYLSDLCFAEELGHGSFGKVCRADLVNCVHNIAIPVAVKILRADLRPKKIEQFWAEAETMAELKHPSILNIIGACRTDKAECLVYEYQICGDLHEYLIAHSNHSDVTISDCTGTPQILSHLDMINIAVQICAGMDFLSSHGIIHADLAARNILVADNMTLKVSNLGTARHNYPSDYCSVPSCSEPAPVRWMSAEAISTGQAQTESDIWSFGVTLWEICSFGLQPYYGCNDKQVISMICAHEILPNPNEGPARMYSLMVECWHKVPSCRPTFSEIHSTLIHWLTEWMMNQASRINANHCAGNNCGGGFQGARNLNPANGGNQSGARCKSNPTMNYVTTQDECQMQNREDYILPIMNLSLCNNRDGFQHVSHPGFNIKSTEHGADVLNCSSTSGIPSNNTSSASENTNNNRSINSANTSGISADKSNNSMNISHTTAESSCQGHCFTNQGESVI